MKICSNELTQTEYTKARAVLIDLRAHHMGTRENLKTMQAAGQPVPQELIDTHDKYVKAVSVFFPGTDDKPEIVPHTPASEDEEAPAESEQDEDDSSNVPPPPVA